MTDKPQKFGSQPRLELQNHPNVGTGSTKGGKFMVLFGLPFMAAGALSIAAGLGSLGEVEKNAPDWVIHAAGGIFLAAGLGMTGTGLRAVLRNWKLEREFELHAHEPWRLDGWDPRRARDMARNVLSAFLGAAFLTLFLTPFNYWAFLSGEGPLPVKGIVILFDLILVAAFGYAFYVLGRTFKYGDARLLFQEYPFVVPNPVRVRFQLPHALQHRFERLECTFRCAEQAWEQRGDSNTLVTYQVYADEQVLPANEVGRELSLTFEVPEGAPSTQLTGDTVVFYELEIKAETPGIDYRGLFLLPVYAYT